jgi:hypothetical protein
MFSRRDLDFLPFNPDRITGANSREEYFDMVLNEKARQRYEREKLLGAPNISGVPNVGPKGPEIGLPEPKLPSLDTSMSRSDEFAGAYDAAVNRKQPRWQSGLLGALRGFGQGLLTGNLAGGLGGAIAGSLGGAINPRNLREQMFEEQTLPRMERRWKLEDMDRGRQAAGVKAAQDSAFNAAKIAETNANTQESLARARKLGEPEPAKLLPQEWKMGTNNETGRLGWFNVADPSMASKFTAYVTPKGEPDPDWRVDSTGTWVNLNAPENKGKKFKTFVKPTAPRSPKEAAKYVSKSQVLQFAEENNMTPSDASAIFKNKGYRVTN